MVRTYVGIGSNIDGEWHIRQGICAMRERFGELIISPVYESEPVGFEGNNFYNLVARFDTAADVNKILDGLDEIESLMDGDSGSEHKASRTLDLDLLLYGNLVIDTDELRLPRADILKYAFVLKPLADLDGTQLHPVLGRSYAELWHSFKGRDQILRRVELDIG